MSYTRFVSLRSVLVVLAIAATSATLYAGKKLPPPPPAPAKSPMPAVGDDYIHKEFGENCSLLGGPPQFVGDLDGDGVDDLIVAGRCKNPLADQAEYGFRVIDPYDSFLGFGDVKVTSTFASDAPERKGVCLLVVHGVGPEAWRSDKTKAKFVLINLPFKTLTVKKLALKKRMTLGVYMEEKGEGESTSSVVFWDGKKYRYQMLGADLE
ncbi:MAG: hypothetical protein WAL56_17940 [Candidatus Sulfotelmatobacter sp.]